MLYQIRNKELTGIRLQGGRELESYYKRDKKYHISPEYITYGDVLVETKRIVIGGSIQIKLYFRNHWYWKPRVHWKYGMRYFHWLFFMIWIDKEYDEVVDKIIADHLKDATGDTTPSEGEK